MSKHFGDFYCLNCLRSFRTKNKLESHRSVCENKYLCNVIMPSGDTKISEFNQHQKKIEKIDECKNNPENSSTRKLSEHIPYGFSMSRISSFRSIENKHDVYRDKDCMKKFCESIKEHARKIINFKKKKIKLLTKKSSRSLLKMQKSVTFVKKNLKMSI